jgi:hypothetical protein
VLQALASKPGISIAKIARRYGWVSETDMPNTAKVHRILQGLERDKLTKNLRGKWRITDAGKAEIKVEPATNEAAQ